MAEITAGAVKSLREKTGAGMIDCKNALVEAAGNEEQAVEARLDRQEEAARLQEDGVNAGASGRCKRIVRLAVVQKRIAEISVIHNRFVPVPWIESGTTVANDGLHRS